MSEFIQKQQWETADLSKSGFQPRKNKKPLVMARVLGQSEAPMQIYTRWGELVVAKAGSIICYTPSEDVKSSLEQYDHWAVDASIFAKTYKKWDQPLLVTDAIQDLMSKGCYAYYKVAGIWAQPYDDDSHIPISPRTEPLPATTPIKEKEPVLTLGIEEKTYHASTPPDTEKFDTKLVEDSKLPEDKSKVKSILNRLIGFLKGDEN